MHVPYYNLKLLNIDAGSSTRNVTSWNGLLNSIQKIITECLVTNNININLLNGYILTRSLILYPASLNLRAEPDTELARYPSSTAFPELQLLLIRTKYKSCSFQSLSTAITQVIC